jgi:dolichol-phosphate mannosyltransferase
MILQSASISRTSDTLVFAPTFNERLTIGPLLDDLLSLPERVDVLIVDDLSCDGTAEYLTARAATAPRLRVIMRPGKLGVGSAHKLAWLQARQHGYSRLVTLDADLSHDPQDVSRVLALLDGGADVAFGSRFLPGGRLDYSGWRLFLSRNANRVASLLLHLPITEYTNSLRAVRLECIPPGLVESIADDGYAFFLNSAAQLRSPRPDHSRNSHPFSRPTGRRFEDLQARNSACDDHIDLAYARSSCCDSKATGQVSRSCG